jgi:hypothetical protein
MADDEMQEISKKLQTNTGIGQAVGFHLEE